MTEPVPVKFSVLNVERLIGTNRLVALVTVEVTIAGATLTLQGGCGFVTCLLVHSHAGPTASKNKQHELESDRPCIAMEYS